MSRTLLVLFAIVSGLAAQTPRLAWSSFVDKGNEEVARVVAPDRDGGIWVAGVSSSNFEVTGPNDPFQANRKGGLDIYIAKYRPESNGGTTLLSWTWLGGDGDDVVTAMTLGPDGRLYLTGYTASANWPLAGDAFQNRIANGAETFAGNDAFIAVFDPTKGGAESLAFSSYYGGSADDIATAIALAPDGTIVIAGRTVSGNLPNIEGAGRLQGVNRGGTDAFVMRCNFSSVLYATYFGGQFTDGAEGVQVDSENRIWVAGWTASTDFPVTLGSLRDSFNTAYDGFLAKLNDSAAGLDALVYCTYLGGNGTDVPVALRLDDSGGLWVGGYTTSAGDLPVTDNALQKIYSGYTDSFVQRFVIAGEQAPALSYSSYFGGLGHDVMYAMAPVPGGRIAITGYVMYGSLPVTQNALQPLPSSDFTDAFVAVINPELGIAGMDYSSYVGAEFTDVATSIASDQTGALYISGYTDSYRFPVTDGSQRTNPPRLPSGLLQKIVRQP